MNITITHLQKVRADLSKKLGLDVKIDVSNVKNNGVYLNIIPKRSGIKSRSNCYYAICDLEVVGVGTSDVISAKIMTTESNLIEYMFMSEESHNIEYYQEINSKLKYGIDFNEDDADREVEGNKLNYSKKYEMTIFIGG